METLPAIILFDGVCNLCNGFVQFVIEHDKTGQFKFASLQSDVARDLLKDVPEKFRNTDSVLLLENGVVYQQSTAALRILRHLAAPWSYFYAFIVVPVFLRNAIYAFIARNRYRWFGQQESCMLPTPELKGRFL